MNTSPASPTISPIQPAPASGPGALAGFEARCSCGLHMKSSLRTLIDQDVREHAAWHAMVDRGAPRRR